MATRDRPNGFWQNDYNVREYMTRLQAVLGYQVIEDWYKVSQRDFMSNDGGGLMNRFNASPVQLLEHIYPEHQWLPWLFNRSPSSTWKSDSTINSYMMWLGQRLNYITMEDWYNISKNDLVNNHGGGLMDRFSGSPTKLLQYVYPEHQWVPWLFIRAPQDIWKNNGMIQDYMVWLGQKLNYTKTGDWYNIKQSDFVNNHGGNLLGKYFHNSPIRILRHVFPEYEWLPWLFNMAPLHTWNDDSTIKSYMIWLGQKLNYNKMEDWYNISQDCFYNNHGIGLLSNCFKDSPIQLLRHVFTDYEWLPWLLKSAPRNTWNDNNTIKDYMTWLGQRLNYTKMEDWYNISQNDFQIHNGGGLLPRFNSSSIQVLQHVYPDYEWLPWLFNHAPQGTWNDDSTIKNYMIWLGQRLKYTKKEYP